MLPVSKHCQGRKQAASSSCRCWGPWSPVQMRSSQEPTAAAFRQWMVLPGDVSLVSKIATEQAVYPGQCWLMPGKTLFPKTIQPEPTAINSNLEKKRCPIDFFFNRKLIPGGRWTSFLGCWSPRKFQWLVTFWNFIWEQPGAQHSKITEGSRFTSSEDFPKRLIKKLLCIYK